MPKLPTTPPVKPTIDYDKIVAIVDEKTTPDRIRAMAGVDEIDQRLAKLEEQSTERATTIDQRLEKLTGQLSTLADLVGTSRDDHQRRHDEIESQIATLSSGIDNRLGGMKQQITAELDNATFQKARDVVQTQRFLLVPDGTLKPITEE